jgi:U3 small nucleolar RNA-associated protein MPP10
LASLFVEGMDDAQIWEQLDLRAKTICGTLEMALQGGGAAAKGEDDEENGRDLTALRPSERKALEKALKDRFGIEPKDVDAFLAANMDSDDNSDEDMAEDGEEGEDGPEGHLGEVIEELHDPSSSDEEEEEDGEYNEEEDEEVADFEHPARSSKLHSRHPRHKPSALDDGFFDLTSFNAETAQAEAKRVSNGSLAAGANDDEEEEEEVDLFRPVDDLVHFDDEDLEGGGSGMSVRLRPSYVLY